MTILKGNDLPHVSKSSFIFKNTKILYISISVFLNITKAEITIHCPFELLKRGILKHYFVLKWYCQTKCLKDLNTEIFSIDKYST